MCNLDIFYNGLWTCMWAYTVSMGVDIEHVWCEHVDYEHVCCEHACWLCTCMLLA